MKMPTLHKYLLLPTLILDVKVDTARNNQGSKLTTILFKTQLTKKIITGCSLKKQSMPLNSLDYISVNKASKYLPFIFYNIA